MSAPEYYRNSRGEAVMTYRVFAGLKDRAVNHLLQASYPPPNRTHRKRRKRPKSRA